MFEKGWRNLPLVLWIGENHRMNAMEVIAIIVAVVGLLKALEWVIEKITSQHDKSQKIDTNADNFAEYRRQNDEEIKQIKKSLNEAHNYAQKSLDAMRKEILDTINKDRGEYLNGIKEVKESITEMSSAYQQTVAIIELKIENLTKQVEKHNSVVERTYANEKAIGILENREAVSEHRLSDLENKQ